jgi:hypothetical protein
VAAVWEWGGQGGRGGQRGQGKGQRSSVPGVCAVDAAAAKQAASKLCLKRARVAACALHCCGGETCIGACMHAGLSRDCTVCTCASVCSKGCARVCLFVFSSSCCGHLQSLLLPLPRPLLIHVRQGGVLLLAGPLCMKNLQEGQPGRWAAAWAGSTGVETRDRDRGKGGLRGCCGGLARVTALDSDTAAV